MSHVCFWHFDTSCMIVATCCSSCIWTCWGSTMKYKYYKLRSMMASSCCGKRSVGYSWLHEQKCQPEMFNRCQYSPVHRRRPLAMQAYRYYTRKLLKHALKIKMRLKKCIHDFTKKNSTNWSYRTWRRVSWWRVTKVLEKIAACSW